MKIKNTILSIAVAITTFLIPATAKASTPLDGILDALTNSTPSVTYGGYGGGCSGHTHNFWCWWYGCSCYNNGGNDIPLDGGLSFLAIAGAGYGVRTVVKRKNKKNSNNK